MKRSRRQFGGFTLVELMIAIVITGFITSAVATLAFALDSANTTSDDISLTQAQVRFAGFRLKELIGNSKLVCAKTGDDLVLWSGDVDGDNDIDIDEIVYIETGSRNNCIQLLEFDNPEYWIRSGYYYCGDQIGILNAYDVKLAFIYGSDYSRAMIIKSCSNVRFNLDKAAPWTEFVSISFDVEVDGVTESYQINSKLRCFGGNLLSSYGRLVSDDD